MVQTPAVLLLEGPNLNLLGLREPQTYGKQTSKQIHDTLRQAFVDRCVLKTFQSNHEGALIDRIHAVLSDDPADALVVNAGALTHTSIALRDALLAVDKPFVEVHLSNVFARESFRRHSTFADLACGVISGMGPAGYHYAVDYLLQRLSATS